MPYFIFFSSIDTLVGTKYNFCPQTWYPYEHDRREYKCKLTCYSRESEEYYQTGENVIDGTRCSYDDEDDICVQGGCVQMGCDMKADSPVAADACGVCGGDGSTCREKVKESRGTTAAEQLTKVMVIPRGARRVSIQVAGAGGGLALVVKERNSGVTVYGAKSRTGNNTRVNLHGASGGRRSANYGAFITEGTQLKIAPLAADEMVRLTSVQSVNSVKKSCANVSHAANAHARNSRNFSNTLTGLFNFKTVNTTMSLRFETDFYRHGSPPRSDSLVDGRRSDVGFAVQNKGFIYSAHQRSKRSWVAPTGI